jgi:pseudouridine-5'-monophosphatase
MDGLLIDSEDIYTLVTNLILQEYGKPNLPWVVKAQLQGRPQFEANRIFHDWVQLPISPTEYATKQAALQAKYFPTTKPLPGVIKLLGDLRSTLNTDSPVQMAIATSSQSKNFKLKTDHLRDILSGFPDSRRVLGDDPRIGKGRGKPLPDIYLLALDVINADIRKAREEEIKPEECLVFEDSVPGVEAGRRAGMRVIWCPHKDLLEVYRGREEEVLAGLTGEHKDEEKSEAEQEAERLQSLRLQDSGRPGKLNDGWGELLHTLEGFPYERYGIVIE